jgi:hypothetical protein
MICSFVSPLLLVGVTGVDGLSADRTSVCMTGSIAYVWNELVGVLESELVAMKGGVSVSGELGKFADAECVGILVCCKCWKEFVCE